MEWPVKIDSHRFTPDVRILFPYDPLVSRADTVIAYEDLNWTQSLFGLRNRVRTALGISQVCYRILKPDVRQVLFAARDTHHPGATCRQKFCRRSPDSPAPARDQGYPPFYSSHASKYPLQDTVNQFLLT